MKLASIRIPLAAVAVAALGLLFTSAPVVSADEPAADGRVSLFNGKDLDGWVRRGGKAKYRAEGGEIVGTSVPNTGNSFLCTKRDYADFILELEFKVDPDLNSGVQIRSECFDRPKTVELGGKKYKIAAGRVHGYQVEIDPSPRAYTGGIYDEGRRGWLQDLKDSVTPTGFIGLQVHAVKKDTPLEVRFRNLRIKELK